MTFFTVRERRLAALHEFLNVTHGLDDTVAFGAVAVKLSSPSGVTTVVPLIVT